MPSITQYPKPHSHLKTNAQRAEHFNMFHGPEREQCLCPLFGQTFTLMRNQGNKAIKALGTSPQNLHMIYADPSAFFSFYLKHNSGVLATDCTMNYKKPYHVPRLAIGWHHLSHDYLMSLHDSMRWKQPNCLADNYTFAALSILYNPPKPTQVKPGLDYWIVDLRLPEVSYALTNCQPKTAITRLSGFAYDDYIPVLHAALRTIVANYLADFSQVWELTAPHPRYLQYLRVVFSLPHV